MSLQSIGLSYTNDGLRADELDELVGHGALGVALSISLEVAEVTNVAGLVGRSTVGLAVGVDCLCELAVSDLAMQLQKCKDRK
jgi:hypothetical protein